MLEWYNRMIKECEDKAKEAAEAADLPEFTKWNAEADNYRRMAANLQRR